VFKIQKNLVFKKFLSCHASEFTDKGLEQVTALMSQKVKEILTL
jgi:hypothetical protein